MMKIAVVGAGVAGSYLLNQLSVKHEVHGYEAQSENGFKAVCAWGASKHPMRVFARNAGLDFDQYILHEGRYFDIAFGGAKLEFKADGIVTFDKKRFEEDMRRGSRITYGARVTIDSLRGKDFDIIIDSTGFHRSVIGRPVRDVVIPSVEYLVRYRNPPFDDFYVEVFKGLTGFIWYFPLGNGLAHVGAGDLSRNHVDLLSRFLHKHKPDEVLDKVGRPIRLAPPSYVMPVSRGRVFAVGESAGTVFPTTGEGIIPSLTHAQLFLDLLEKESLARFGEETVKKFRLHEEMAYVFFERLLKGRRGLREALRLMVLAFEFRVKSKRFGIKPGILDLVKTMIKYY